MRYGSSTDTEGRSRFDGEWNTELGDYTNTDRYCNLNCANHDFYCGGVGYNSVYEVPTANFANEAVFGYCEAGEGEATTTEYTGDTAEE